MIDFIRYYLQRIDCTVRRHRCGLDALYRERGRHERVTP
jgi:hypothetical protein